MSDRTTSAAAQTQNTNFFAQKNRDEVAKIAAQLEREQTIYQGLLPTTVSWTDFRNAFLIAVQSNWRLLNADRMSLFLALRKAAQQGLMPDGNEGALVIFNDEEIDEDGNPVPAKADAKKKSPMVQWMPMVHGLIKLVRNTGNVASLRAKLIYKGERLTLTDQDGKESYIHERIVEAGKTLSMNDEDVVGAFAVILYKDGFWEIEVMSRQELDKIERSSKAKNGPWKTWKQRMQAKTVFHRLFRRIEKSPENALAMQAIADDATMQIDGTLGELDTQIADEFKAPATPVKAPPTPPTPPPAAATPPATRGPGRPPKAAPPAAAAPPPPPAPPAPPPPEPDLPPAPENEPPEHPQVGSEVAEIWAAGEDGEAWPDQMEPMSEIVFAQWFDRHASIALREQNMDNIAEACSDPEARKIITAALDRISTPAAPAQQAEPSRPGDMARPLPVPNTPTGRPDWPLYRKRIVAALGELTETADVLDWQEINEPNFLGKPYEAQVMKLIEDRLSSLNLAKAAPSFNLTPPPGAADFTTQDAKTIHEEIVREARARSGDEQILAWWDSHNLQPRMARLKKLDVDLFRSATAVIDERRLAT